MMEPLSNPFSDTDEEEMQTNCLTDLLKRSMKENRLLVAELRKEREERKELQQAQLEQQAFVKKSKRQSQEVKSAVHDAYKRLSKDGNEDGTGSFRGWSPRESFHSSTNQQVVKAVTTEVKAANAHALSPADILAALRVYFKTHKDRARMQADGVLSQRKRKLKREERKRRKLTCRRKALELSTSLPEERKKKIFEILSLEFMSSEESGDGDSSASSGPSLVVHPLPWKSREAREVFDSLDRKARRKASARSRNMTLRRIVGEPDENRPIPAHSPEWALTVMRP